MPQSGVWAMVEEDSDLLLTVCKNINIVVCLEFTILLL